MRTLGEKLIRDSGFILIKVARWVLKVAVSIAALRELAQEQKKLQAASADSHFSRYVPTNRFGLFFSATHFMVPLVDNPKRNELIQQYFATAFSNHQQWPTIFLAETAGMNTFSDFIKVNFPPILEAWNEYIKKTSLFQASSHGDFFWDNILVENNQLKFIDWWQYEAVSCRYFDLINFHIFDNKRSDERWIDVWQRNLANVPVEIFGVMITKEYYQAYAVWKVARELGLLGLRGKLPTFKIKKYQAIIRRLTTIILPNVSQN